MRRTVTVEDNIHRSVQKIRAKLIEETGEDFSYTTTVNMLLLGGLIGVSKFDDEDWNILYDFLRDKKSELEFKALEDQIADNLLKRIRENR